MDLQSIVCTDVPVYYTCYLVVMLHACLACQHLTPGCDVLDCFRGVFAQSTSGVLSGVVDPSLHRSSVWGLFLCSHDQCLYARGVKLIRERAVWLQVFIPAMQQHS